jgi:hypothetical protein
MIMFSGKQLRSYLAYTILGRKPMRQAKTAQRKGPPRDEAYKAWIRTQPSLISGLTPCEACHTGNDGGMSMKASDFSCVPLTWEEHREYHRIGKAAFEKRYGLSFSSARKKLLTEWKARGTKWKTA